MKLIVNAKDFFFDRVKVLDAIDKGRVKALSKIGAFVRRSAKSSIKSAGKKGKVSAPGEPPRSRKGLLKDFIFFTYDPESKSVVTGPELLPRAKEGSATIAGGKTVPELLEFGGQLTIHEMRLPTWLSEQRGLAPPQWRPFAPGKLPTDPRIRRETRDRRATVAERPFMGPALERESKNDKLAEAFRDVVN